MSSDDLEEFLYTLETILARGEYDEIGDFVCRNQNTILYALERWLENVSE